MPIYEYQCQACQATFERLIRSHRDRPDECPSCGATELRKLFSTFSASVAPTAGGGTSPRQCPSGGCCSGHNGGCPLT